VNLTQRLVIQNVAVVAGLTVVLATANPGSRETILIVGGVATLISILLSFTFARSVFRPILQLRDMAQALTKHDAKLRTDPTIKASGEVQELVTSFKQLSSQLEALGTTRRDFVANVSHELRTPLTIIGGFAETLTDENTPPDARRQFAEMILANTRRMQRIVDDLLDLSRIESGGWVPRPIEIDLKTAIAETVSETKSVAERKGVQIETSVAPNASRAFLDRTALRQILSNLIENAIRYTPSGGRVTVFTEPDSTAIWIGVKDTGEGIPPEHLPRIFERFYRVDSGRAREDGGTGLGLAIVRHLTEAHGGDVQATSEVGRGTTIRVRLPLQ
jgi:signal transduction histidine kinase